MAVTATPIFPQTIKNGVVQIANSDASNLKTVYTAGANGTKIENISVTSTDTSARDLQFSLSISATTYILGTVTIPANSGNTNSIITFSVLTNAQFGTMSVDSNGNKYLYLASGTTLQVKALTTVTSAKTISVIAQAGDF